MVPELSWSCRSKARRAETITSSGSVSLYTDIPSRLRVADLPARLFDTHGVEKLETLYTPAGPYAPALWLILSLNSLPAAQK